MTILRMRVRAVLLATGAFIAVSLASPACAQSTEAQARALFEEGVELYDGGQLAEAEDRFRRSLALRTASSVRYNLAAVLAQTGHPAEARTLYLLVADDPGAPDRVRQTSRDRARDLETRLARLTVELTGAADGVVVRLDERELEGAGPHLVDPGSHVLVAQRTDATVFRRDLTLAEGEHHTVAVLTQLPSPERDTAPSRMESAAPVEPVPASSEQTGARFELVEQWWLWSIVGLAVAAAAVGGVLIGIAVEEGRYFFGNVPPGRFVVE